jgi:hypothetical protein
MLPTKLTPCRSANLENLPVEQLLKSFPEFYGTRRYHYRVHKFPPLVHILRQINPVHYQQNISNIILILSFHLYIYIYIDLLSGLFLSGFPHKSLTAFHFSPLGYNIPRPSQIIPKGIIGNRQQQIKRKTSLNIRVALILQVTLKQCNKYVKCV